MRILLLGKNGQVGWELQRSLSPLGTLLALDRASTPCGDLTNVASLTDTIRTYAPNVIVNAAAYTAVDKAESDFEVASKVNTAAPELLAKEAARLNALLIHYSTDYVFDGTGIEPRDEDAQPNPLNVYGTTKLLGERAIVENCSNYLILRTSWVYGVKGNNFAKTILRLAGERDILRVIDDQIGAPTSAELLADITALILRDVQSRTVQSGIYHVAASGEVSWLDYARFVIEQAQARGLALPARLEPTTTEEYKAAATRPLNSRLNTHRFQETFSLHLPKWHEGVVRMLNETI